MSDALAILALLLGSGLVSMAGMSVVIAGTRDGLRREDGTVWWFGGYRHFQPWALIAVCLAATMTPGVLIGRLLIGVPVDFAGPVVVAVLFASGSLYERALTFHLIKKGKIQIKERVADESDA